MYKRPGIDSEQPDFMLFIKLNLPFNDREQATAVLRAIGEVDRQKTDPERAHGEFYNADGSLSAKRLAVRDHRLNLLVGFSLRFFAGPIGERPEYEAIPNFPPGGSFTARPSTRFDMKNRKIPMYLRTMNADGDKLHVKKRLARDNGGKEPTDPEVDAAYRKWLAESESDLLLLIESNNRFLTVDFWDAIRKAIEPFKVEVVSLHDAFNRGDRRDHIGYYDGLSNLDDKMANDPGYYRRKIYLPHPAPPFPGESTEARDDPHYDGGTYMVHRKYIEHLDKWNSDKFKVKDFDGNTYHGEEARAHSIGRDRETGRVISRFHGKIVEKEPDSSDTDLMFYEAHGHKARGATPSPFCGPFPPLDAGQSNVFHIQDIRIRRRGANYCEMDKTTGQVTYGINFLCFQNNIQQTGFEFINNIWLLNPCFLRNTDGLFDPDAGIVEPIEGCYYFVPPEHREFAGDIFFK
ncbi:MAG: deferrochelatase/peroxidase EfeB [Blastocatellia bacterium]|jgi:deferrochelatase/peroxidase EfeB|nr:deferrochelatase/peroxidase EfeB [Blastocatellia bacterium]